MRQDDGLQVDNQLFVRRKNEVVGELYLTVEVVTATFGIEMHNIERQRGFHFMFMIVSQTMHTIRGSIAETAHHVMVFGAIVELHIPSSRDEQHHKGH